jgi:hypothetical protein
MTQLSKEAIARIEELGGTAVSVHHTTFALKSLTRPNAVRFSAPVHHRERVYYSDPQNRGYLVPDIWKRCVDLDGSFAARHVRCEPTPLPPSPVPFRDFLAAKLDELKKQPTKPETPQ